MTLDGEQCIVYAKRGVTFASRLATTPAATREVAQRQSRMFKDFNLGAQGAWQPIMIVRVKAWKPGVNRA